MFAGELDEIREALALPSLDRVADGELQDLRWQVDTFGFHALSLEVRQHSEALAAARRATAGDVEADAGVTARKCSTHSARSQTSSVRCGTAACRRYVISFTRSAE